MAAIMADWSLVLMCFFSQQRGNIILKSWMSTFKVGCQPARAESADGLPQPSES